MKQWEIAQDAAKPGREAGQCNRCCSCSLF